MPRPTSGPVGRPRRFDDETERRLLVGAAARVMERNGNADVSVDDILAEARLSTRAFYRHFGSKEALLETFMRREAESVGRSLSRAVASRPDPVEGVMAWMERFLDVFYEPRRARRAAMLSRASAGSSGPSVEMMEEMRDIACRSLAEALRAGHEQGRLYSPTPAVDAHSIHDLVVAARAAGPGRDAARNHVLRFVLPALRLERDDV